MPIRKCKSSSSFDIEIDEGVRQWYCELYICIYKLEILYLIHTTKGL